MSVAAATTPETKTTPMSLWAASVMGGIYVLAALAVVFFGVPRLWNIGVSPWLVPAVGGLMDDGLRIVAQIAALVILTVFGLNLAGPHPQRGLRGGIVLTIVTIAVGFFLIRAVLMSIEGMATKPDFGHIVSLLFIGFLLFLFYKYIKSDRMFRWAQTVESAGWLGAAAYKPRQGVKVRRLTILGVLLIFGTGIYTMVHNGVIGHGDWVVSLPFTNGAHITLLPDAHLTGPLILIGLALWFAWRIVNFPVFADFLIATEAEINKVSWTPRARLVQDTIVVLVTVFIITMFLFVVDVFWGWILSRNLVGVLPSESDKKPAENKQITNEW